MLYALSTCPWCRKTKVLLENLRVDYDFENVDLLSSEKRREVMKTVKKLNPALSFPILVVGDIQIIGYKEDKIKEVLKASGVI